MASFANNQNMFSRSVSRIPSVTRVPVYRDPDVPVPNASFVGFPEVPDDAFDMLDHIPVPALRRSYKAYCPRCCCNTTSYVRTQRNIACNRCELIGASIIQRNTRGFIIRRKYNYLIKKGLMNRWLLTKGISGDDLSWNIMQFL